MKLIVTGATGLVASEVLRQSLRVPRISSVVAVSRSPVKLDGVDTSKLKNVVLKEYDEYPEDAQKAFAGADACIWTVGIVPKNSGAYSFEQLKHVCHDSTMIGLKAMLQAGPAKPFRFLYMSGIGGERDQTKKPAWMPEYALMRGETENQVLALAAEHKGDVEAACAKPGLILEPGQTVQSVLGADAGPVPNIQVSEVAAAMLSQVMDGFEMEPLMNDDLARIGRAKI